MLNKGDTCYVRYQGKIINAIYIQKSCLVENAHWVGSFLGKDLFATKKPSMPDECRFVVMSGMRKEYVDSINN